MSDIELSNWKRRQAAKNGPAQAECCSGECDGWREDSPCEGECTVTDEVEYTDSDGETDYRWAHHCEKHGAWRK